MRIQKIDGGLTFTRKPNSGEMQVYTRSVNKGLDLLGKQVDIILHNASAPAVKSENTGIGSLFSRTSITKLFPFLKNHGITGIQQEPNGLRKVLDNSPYAPESNAKNIFMIPLEKLTTEEYGNILSKKTFEAIVNGNPNDEQVNYPYVRKMYDVALREAYNNGKDSKEFAEFKAAREQDYEQSAIYRVLSKINGLDNSFWGSEGSYSETDYHATSPIMEEKDWNEVDKNLYLNRDSQESQARIAELKEKYKDDYDYFLFQQMILEKENEKTNKISEEMGIKIIGDSPVAPTDVETWVNKNLFLKGKAIGCPPDHFSRNGQRWGFKYYDPEKIFNEDGSLGEAGEILKKKYEEYFASFPGGIRIDHIIGLIDPFIYTVDSDVMTPENSGRIYSIPGKYQKHSDEEFANMLTKIIIPAAEKYGLKKSSIICEDLGDRTAPVRNVMQNLNLSGIAVTQYGYRGSKTPEKDVIMLGSHDNCSFLEYVENLFNFNNNHDKTSRFMKRTQYIAEDTVSKDASGEQQGSYLHELRTNKKSFLFASFVELFTSPARRVQIFFSDLFGIGKTYNIPGTTQGNWSLRLGENFEEDYYKKASEGTAPNIPGVIAAALRHRGLDKGNEQLMQDLDNSARIISEK